MLNVFVFDIETIPDANSGRKLFNMPAELSDADTVEAMYALRRGKTGNDFLPLHLHKIVAISVVLRTDKRIKVWSLGEEDAAEPELIQRFYTGIDKFTPTIVSWNGGGFDLPVLHYRALLHQISAPRYWETGDVDNNFRWNNYINRYHSRHLDLMDVLSNYQMRACAPLDQIATMLGYPGKMGMDGSKVWDAYQAGNIPGIRNYCETDVLNTYLVYLRFEVMRGNLTSEHLKTECDLLKDYLESENKAHFAEFLAAWV